MATKKQKKILLVIPPKDFFDDQLERIQSIIESQGIQTDVATKVTKSIKGVYGQKVKPDVTLINLDPALYLAVFLIGGPGVEDFLEDKLVISLVQTFNFVQKWIIGVDNAIAIMARAGILKEIEATCLPGDKEELIKGEGKFVDKDFLVEKNIITAKNIDVFNNNNTELISRIIKGYDKK